MTDAVGIDFGIKWRWGGWKLFTATLSCVWHQMPQIIMWFLYGGMEFWHDLDMVLPPGND
jgi:hypothetical protein